jgi:hypothetical protein
MVTYEEREIANGVLLDTADFEDDVQNPVGVHYMHFLGSTDPDSKVAPKMGRDFSQRRTIYRRAYLLGMYFQKLRKLSWSRCYWLSRPVIANVDVTPAVGINLK